MILVYIVKLSLGDQKINNLTLLTFEIVIVDFSI